MFLMLHIRILVGGQTSKISAGLKKKAGINSLFGIISNIGEYSRIKTSLYTVTTLNDNPMLIGFYKIIIKQGLPLSMQ
jgi:hypothetical protein